MTNRLGGVTPNPLLRNAAVVETIAILGMVVAGAIIRSVNLSLPAASPDELNYLERATVTLGSNWTWHTGYMWDQPPLFLYLLAAVMTLGGGSLEVLRLVSVLAGSVTIAVVYLLARSMFGVRAGLVAGAVVMLNGFSVLYSRTIFIEPLEILLIMTSLYFFWNGVAKKQNLRLAILGGLFLGLAFDTKYIAIVLMASLVFYLLLCGKRLGNKLPRRELLGFATSSLTLILPLLAVLAANQANPFYWLASGRFQSLSGLQSGIQSYVTSGQGFTYAFTKLLDMFTHVSSIDPFGAFALFGLESALWAIVLAVTISSGVVLLLRRSPNYALMMIVFAGFFAFAVVYPARRDHFFDYPIAPLAVVMGGVVSAAAQRVRVKRKHVVTVLSALVITVYVSAMATNAVAVPTFYKPGFGVWDEVLTIMDYVGSNHEPNAVLATNRAPPFYYANVLDSGVQVVTLVQPVSYYSTAPANRIFMTPVSGQYPILWVLSTTVIEQTHPQFIVTSRSDFEGATPAFRAYVEQRYTQPISTNAVLLFQRIGPPMAVGPTSASGNP